jgi:hypothetical protein
MKQALLISLMVLLFGMHAGTGIAEQKSTKGVVIQAGAQYNPAVIYAGQYKSDVLFFKSQGEGFWRRLARVDRLRRVTCPDAQAQLSKEGAWKGHLNLKNGSCATPDEPADWALGNRINFDAQIHQLENN